MEKRMDGRKGEREGEEQGKKEGAGQERRNREKRKNDAFRKISTVRNRCFQ